MRERESVCVFAAERVYAKLFTRKEKGDSCGTHVNLVAVTERKGARATPLSTGKRKRKQPAYHFNERPNDKLSTENQRCHTT